MINKEAQQLGKLGGEATASKGSEYMAELGKKGSKVRWGAEFDYELKKKAKVAVYNHISVDEFIEENNIRQSDHDLTKRYFKIAELDRMLLE